MYSRFRERNRQWTRLGAQTSNNHLINTASSPDGWFCSTPTGGAHAPIRNDELTSHVLNQKSVSEYSEGEYVINNLNL